MSVQNALREPDNPKLRRVRCSNEAYKARVASAAGAEPFLRAAGWRDATLQFERHLLLPEPSAACEECVRGGSAAATTARGLVAR